MFSERLFISGSIAAERGRVIYWEVLSNQTYVNCNVPEIMNCPLPIRCEHKIVH